MQVDAPIVVVKNGISYPVHKYQELERPFSFEIKGGESFGVGKNDLPVYFARKRQHMKGSKCIRAYVHRFCVGAIRWDGVQDTHWIFPDGTYDKINEETLRMAE